MKTTANILILLALVLGACSSTYRAGVGTYDDLYYTPRSADMESESVQSEPQPLSQGGQVEQEEELSDYAKYRMAMENEYMNSTAEDQEFAAEDTLYYNQADEGSYDYYDDGSTPVINNYYGDVYQYPSYTTRIRRFQSPYIGFSYYDPWYYNSWYDPWYYSYSPGWSFSLGLGYSWGWGSTYYGWSYPYYGYRPYYSYWDPFYSWGYGGSYWRGYRDGYWDGYYWGGGYYPYYYGTSYRDYYGTGRSYTYGYRNSRSGYSTYGVRSTDPKSDRNVTATGRTRTATSTGSDAGRSRVQTAGNGTGDRLTSGSSTERRVAESRDNSTETRQQRSTANTDRGQTTSQSPISRYNSTSRQSYTPSYTVPRTTTRPSYNSGASRSTATQSQSSSSSRSSTLNRSSSSYRSSTPSRSSSSSIRSSTPSRSSSSSVRSSTPSRSSGSSTRSSGGTRSSSSGTSSSGGRRR